MDIMADPDIRKKLSSLSMPTLGTNAVQLAKTWDAEVPVYRMLFKSANLEPN